MFPEMRRFRQQLSPEQCADILTNATSGVLALAGDDGYPYALPMSFCFDGESLWFHCALEGHKLRAIERCPKVSFCVVQQDEVVPQRFTTYYRSVIVFGEMEIVTDPDQWLAAAKLLGRKYAPAETEQRLQQEIDTSGKRMHMLKLTPRHITGKQAKELIPQS